MFAQATFARRLSLFLASLFSALMLLAPLASAQTQTHNLCKGADLTFGEDKTPCASDDGTAPEGKVNKLLADVINFISVVVGVLAVIMILYAGFRFVTSAGNPESTKTARNTILYAIIGLVIVAFAQLIVKFVLNKVTQ